VEPDTALLSDLLQRILRVTKPLKVILFGSAGRGEMGSESDLDLLIVVRNGLDARRTSRSIYRNLIGFGAAVDVVVATQRDIELYGDNFSLVYYRALREGREIYAA